MEGGGVGFCVWKGLHVALCGSGCRVFCVERVLGI